MGPSPPLATDDPITIVSILDPLRSKNREHLIKFIVRNNHNVASCLEELDKDMSYDQVHLTFFLVSFSSLRFFFMADVGLFDEIICSTDQIILNLQHFDDGVNVMIKKGIILFSSSSMVCLTRREIS